MAIPKVKKKSRTQVGDVTIEETRELELMGIPKTPVFPIIILSIAILKDGMDIATLGLLGWLGSVLVGFVLWIWIITKSNAVERRLLRWFVRRVVIVVIVGFIPIINFLPEMTIFVFLIHNKEKGVVRVFYNALERLPIKV